MPPTEQPSLAPAQAIAVPLGEPSSPASAPLNLERAVVRAANRASKSEARRMAESSGAYFGDRRVSEAESLASAIKQAAKPDCLGPDAGGSLLSLPVIIFYAATDRCN